MTSDEMSEPRFGDWMQGVYASEDNPHKYGIYVRTIYRRGGMNPGKHYQLTDGNGSFWEYPVDAVKPYPNKRGQGEIQ